MIVKKEYGYMVSVLNNEISKTSLEVVASQLKMVDPDSEIIKQAKTIGISFGD